MLRRAFILPLLSVYGVALVGCADRSVPTIPMPGASASFAKEAGEPETKKLFKEYVAMGSSIAAGFMSGGINDSTQLLAYPNILADRGGAKKFDVPLLAKPGCPAPWVAPITPSAPGCAGRANDVLPPGANNVAVPGIRIAEALVAPANPADIYNLLLGGSSEVQAMLAAKPTFVTAELGDNDVFEAALAGTVGPVAPNGDSLVTRLASFQSSYNQIATAIASVNQLRGAVLVGVIDPLLGSPILQPGAYFFLARDATGRFLGKPVNVNCSPVTALGQPNPLATNLVSFQILLDANVPEINCDPAAFPLGDPRRGAYLLDPAEQLLIHTRVLQYNAIIAQLAAANGWAYVDPNIIIAGALASRTNGRADQLRKCQDLPNAATAAALQLAVLNTCPVTGPTAAPNFFGALISFDGVHPSAVGQQALANLIAAGINAKYGTALATF
jgi:lysophospholipase L1-like esterase